MGRPEPCCSGSPRISVSRPQPCSPRVWCITWATGSSPGFPTGSPTRWRSCRSAESSSARARFQTGALAASVGSTESTAPIAAILGLVLLDETVFFDSADQVAAVVISICMILFGIAASARAEERGHRRGGGDDLGKNSSRPASKVLDVDVREAGGRTRDGDIGVDELQLAAATAACRSRRSTGRSRRSVSTTS